MSDRYEQLLPPDVISAVKSMPRRWASAFQVTPSTSIDEVLALTGEDGATVAEHTGAFLAQVRTLTDAIRKTRYSSGEEVDADVEAAVSNSGSAQGPPAGADAIDAIEALMQELANTLEALSSSDWTKTAVAPSGTISIAALAQGAVRVAAERLRVVERAVGGVS